MTASILYGNRESGHCYKVKLALVLAEVHHEYREVDLDVPFEERREDFREAPRQRCARILRERIEREPRQAREAPRVFAEGRLQEQARVRRILARVVADDDAADVHRRQAVREAGCQHRTRTDARDRKSVV